MVEKGGLWLSEFPPGTAPLKQHFPFRNRIIAGLCRGTLVVEAAPGSGALLTAKHALEANREVFAVPGNIFSEQSSGTNELIKLGAHPVTTTLDVLNVFGLAETTISTTRPSLNPAQAQLLELLTAEPQSLNELVRQSGLTPAELMAQLTFLEVAEYVREVGSQNFVRLP
jgi:DNA processing protein